MSELTRVRVARVNVALAEAMREVVRAMENETGETLDLVLLTGHVRRAQEVGARIVGGR